MMLLEDGTKRPYANALKRKKKMLLTCKDTRRISKESGQVKGGVLHTKAESFCHLTEEQMNEGFGKLIGTMLLGVNTPCTLWNEGSQVILTRKTSNISDRPHSITSSNSSCEDLRVIS